MRLPSNGMGFTSNMRVAASTIFGIASSRTAFDGHRTHEKQTVST